MKAASAPRADYAGSARGRHLPLLVALTVLAIFLGMTWLLWKGAQQMAVERIKASLQYDAIATGNRIERRMAMYEQMLHGVRGFIASSPGVDREKFRRYVAELDVGQLFPGIQGIGYAERVSAAEKSAHVARIRAEGFSGYTIRPDSERDVYAPIIFMEPFSGDNLKVFGFDPYSAAAPRKAMDNARDSNAIISAKLQLQQDAGRGNAPGFVMYLPVYRVGPMPMDVQGRRSEIVGWIDAPFNMKALMAGVDGDRPLKIAYSIHDGRDISPSSLMYASKGFSATDVAATQLTAYQQQIIVAGRHWTLLAKPLPGTNTYGEFALPRFIAKAGIAMSLLLAWLAWLLASGRQRALAIAREMTSDLKDSEARLHAIIDSAEFSIITIDENGSIQSMNQAALRVFGYTADEVLGSNVSMLMPDPHRQRHDGYIRHYLETGQARIIGKPRELVAMRKDGSTFPMELTVSEMSILGQRAFTGMIHDITLRKEAEARLLTRSAALARANRELNRFAEVSAHHLVEPIRRLGSYTQLLRASLHHIEEAHTDKLVQMELDTLENDASRLRILVRDIERYVSAGLPSDDVAMTDANLVVHSIQQQLAKQIDHHGARLQVTPLPAANMDRGRLSTLFCVLIENALTHGSPADPSVALLVDISGEREGQLSRYRVRDNGNGIPVDFSERVFNIFERLETGPSGTGIGLSIARRIVESCAGRIWIENNAGQGAIVVFELPDSCD